jgi:hypothetical protein
MYIAKAVTDAACGRGQGLEAFSIAVQATRFGSTQFGRMKWHV